ncbi:hypothetical protein [Nocardioides perillae]|uniref:Restriction system protein Mrr-like N-terminal domain-containing protein n=1 Tax=Nocardioides perillae TaxID=1119534 RepID=A0A7Y9UM40_9ACTN|nr:hypothetical protein [Nocardioides perillae]NYG55001.1 hypothetical protein [Nocardioides perillae]
MADDYCEHCDLPLSQCVHGRPAPVAPPAPPKASPVRTRAASAPSSGTTARAPRAAKAAPVKRAVVRKWTQPAELRPAILAVLQDAEAPLGHDEAFARLEERVGDALRPGDRDPNPQGEMRWRAAARKARKELIDEGLLAQAPGTWGLTDAGRAADLGPLA